MERSFDYENKNTNFLSTTDESFLKILGMLKEKFPNPSIFEGK
jgi:methyltransferase-like protein